MVATSTAPFVDQRAKVVVRHLPPGLAADGFRSVVAGWVDKADYFRYVQGKQSTKELVHSRAYLRFTDPQDVPLFTQQLHGHAFVTERGTQYRCSVEYAPYQKVPRARTKKDPREGTLKKDADYLAFLERLQAGPTLLPSAETQLTSKDGETSAGAPVVTALMQFLAEKRLQPKAAQTSAGTAGRERKSSKAEQAQRQQGKATKAAAAAAAAAVVGTGKRVPAGGKELLMTVGAAGKGAKQKQGHAVEAAEHQAPKVLKPAKGKGAASAPTVEPGSAQGAGQAGPAAAPAKDAKAASRGDKKTGKQQGGQQPHETQPAATPKKLLKKPPGGATGGDAGAAPAAAAPQPAATQQQAQQQGQQQQQRKGSSGRKQQQAPAPAAAATGAGAPPEGKRILARKPAAGQQAEQATSSAQQPSEARDTAAPATAGERKGARRQQQQGQGGAAGAAGTDAGTSSQPAVADASQGAQQQGQQQQQRPSRRTRPGWGGVYQPKRVGRLLGEEGEEGT